MLSPTLSLNRASKMIIDVKATTEPKEKKIKHFQYVHFRIPLYKHPGAALLSIFIPIYVLGFINLVVFFQ